MSQYGQMVSRGKGGGGKEREEVGGGGVGKREIETGRGGRREGWGREKVGR